MYALDNDSGVQTMPEVKAKKFNHTEPRWFTEGGNGVAPSYPGADWFNIVQAELLGVLTAGGIHPDKTNLNQLTQAIQQVVQNKVNVALSGKADTQHNHAIADVQGLQEALNSKVGNSNAGEITGQKTFTSHTKLVAGLRISSSKSNESGGHYSDMYADSNTTWMVFKGKTFRWHNDGRFTIDNKKFFSEQHKPRFSDLEQRPTTIAGYGITDLEESINRIISYQKINDFEVIKFSNGLLVQIYESSNPISRSRNAGDNRHEFYWAQAFINKPKVLIQSVNKAISTRFNFSLDIKFSIQYIESSNAKCVFTSSEDSAGDPIHIYAIGLGSWK
ncbi:TPA: hypothetical protein QB226_000421 [Pasteurella multocida]|nr:hypothetical protein [Pasteurella multocida]